LPTCKLEKVRIRKRTTREGAPKQQSEMSYRAVFQFGDENYASVKFGLERIYLILLDTTLSVILYDCLSALQCRRIVTHVGVTCDLCVRC